MHYDSVFDKWHEECGVFGIYDRHLNIGNFTYWGLFALQHRGQESAGIAISNGKDIEVTKGMGLLTEAIKNVTGCRRRLHFFRSRSLFYDGLQ